MVHVFKVFVETDKDFGKVSMEVIVELLQEPVLRRAMLAILDLEGVKVGTVSAAFDETMPE